MLVGSFKPCENFFGDNWTTGTGNIDWFRFPTHLFLEIKMKKKSLIYVGNIIIFPGKCAWWIRYLLLGHLMRRNSCIRNSQFENWAYLQSFNIRTRALPGNQRAVELYCPLGCLKGALRQKMAHLPWIEAEQAHPCIYTLQHENMPRSSIKIIVIMYNQIFHVLICSFQNQEAIMTVLDRTGQYWNPFYTLLLKGSDKERGW